MNDGWETCTLCGIVGMPTQISMFLAIWRRPEEHGGKPYHSLVRCRDAQACRDRYETAERRWPLDDQTTPTVPVAVRNVTPLEALGATTLADAEPSRATAREAEPDVDPDDAWLLA